MDWDDSRRLEYGGGAAGLLEDLDEEDEDDLDELYGEADLESMEEDLAKVIEEVER